MSESSYVFPNRHIATAVKEFADKFIEHNEYDSYSISISHNRDDKETSIELAINKDRVFCATYGNCFLSRYQLQNHKSSRPTSCLSCRQCFTNDDHVVHALEFEHDRCFVLGCSSREREERGWENSMIKTHVRDKYGCSNDSLPPQYSTTTVFQCRVGLALKRAGSRNQRYSSRIWRTASNAICADLCDLFRTVLLIITVLALFESCLDCYSVWDRLKMYVF
jgi:hypothetical protein